jgi:Ca2+-binding EF-hand superfamily protein
MTSDDDEATREAREIFTHFDRNGNGTIDIREFASLMRALGALGSIDELISGMEAVDSNADGHLTFAEFARWWNDR